MPNILITADIHLHSNENHPINQCFLNFLKQEATHCQALYLLGDIFEMWVGDDIGLNEQATIIEQFKKLTDKGVPIYLIYGNRDFLLGKAFWQATGIQHLAEPYLLKQGDQQFILAHGDHLCTDDKAYQKMRAWFRNPFIQWLFLKLPKSKRLQIGQDMRAKSQQFSQNKAGNIMDVNEQAVDDLFQQFPEANALIHGHTHRPDCHKMNVNGQSKTRWVLGDWRPEADYLSIDAKGNIQCLNTLNTRDQIPF